MYSGIFSTDFQWGWHPKANGPAYCCSPPREAEPSVIFDLPSSTTEAASTLLVVENICGKGVFSNVVKCKDQVEKSNGTVAIKARNLMPAQLLVNELIAPAPFP